MSPPPAAPPGPVAADPARGTAAEPSPGPSGPGRRTALLGLAGAVLAAAGSVGAGGILVEDPLLSGGPLSWVRYGHGRDLAAAVLYAGVGLLVWAWVRLGRDVLAGAAGPRRVLTAAALWTAPVLVAAPLFTRDVYSYLAQGDLALRGLDPYEVGPAELPRGSAADNVHSFWQTTPAPYGPLFILLASQVVRVTGDGAIAGVLLVRAALLVGLALLVWAVPRLARRLSGDPAVALWLAVANPMTVVHLVGGVHNDLLMIGLLAAGTVLVLDRRHAAGIALVSMAAAVKATGAIALPFLVLVWAARLPGSRWVRTARAAAASVAVFVAVFAVATLAAGVDLGWIPALSAPSLIVNWMSLPTGAAELVHGLASLVADVPMRPVLQAFRGAGLLLLAAVAVRQWWLARDGGPDAVRRAAVVLFWAALLSPTLLPWYLTWSLALGAGLAWARRPLAVLVAASTWLVLSSFPSGEAAIYTWWYVLGTAALSALAGVALLRPDPLRLGLRAAPAGPP